MDYRQTATRRPNQDALLQQFSAPGLQAPTEGRELPEPAAPAAVAQHSGTKLYGTLDQGKLNDPNHALKSPKYQLLQTANQGKYGYDQIGDLLKDLQGQNPDRWGGWSAQGDKLRFGGGQLDGAFNGATELDIIHGFKDPNGPGGWGFQTNLPDGVGGGTQQMPLQAQGMPPLDAGSGLAGVQQNLAQLSQPTNIQALLARLQGPMGSNHV